MLSSSSSLRRLLESKGIDPSAEPTPEPPFDPIAWRTDLYTRQLEQEVPTEFVGAMVAHPDVAAWMRRHLDDPSADPWLVLTGNTGTGKTHAAYALVRAIVLAGARGNRRCRWNVVTHPDLNAALRPKPDESHAYALDPYLHGDLTVLDDLGAGKHSDYTSDNLLRLVDHRWSHRLATIYTSNLDPAGLEEVVGERVMSRLSDATTVALSGADRRWRGEVHGG